MPSKFIAGHVGVQNLTITWGTRASHQYTDVCLPHLCLAGAGYSNCRSCIPRFFSSCPNTMTLTSTNDSVSIFEDGKLRPGTYKVQNVCSQTYVDIREHSKELCGRPDTVLKGKGLVGACPRLAPIVAGIMIFSGKFALGDLDTQYAGYSVEPRFSLSCTERGNIARPRHARTILHHARWVRKWEPYCRCHLSRPLENRDSQREG